MGHIRVGVHFITLSLIANRNLTKHLLKNIYEILARVPHCIKKLATNFTQMQ